MAALLASLASGQVVAKEAKSARNYRTAWIIEPASPPEGARIAKEGELLIQQRLLPTGMAVLSGDYKAAVPEEGVAQGTQLLLAEGAEYPVYCSTRYKRPGTLSRIISTGPETGTQRCFVDIDGDGKFDQTFLGFNNIRVLPGVFGRLPKAPILIEPISYAKTAVSEFSENYFVGIQYIQRGGLARNKRQFRLVYGSGEPWGAFSFDQTPSIKDSDFPKVTGEMGASITIIGGDRESVTYKVMRMIPAQPFGVVVQTFYY